MGLEGDLTFPLETGGVLLGYRAEGGDLVVQDIVGPGPKAIHERYSFTPDNHYHTQAISNAFYRSDGLLLYLGDWHTHPQGVPRLSSTDKRTIKRIAKSKESMLPTPVMMLLAGGMGAWEYAAFQYEGHSIWTGVTTALREVKRF
jgi:integrative and conjugative element protein (TIGR02256 family)